MKYFSELTKLFYNSQKECEDAENNYRAEELAKFAPKGCNDKDAEKLNHINNKLKVFHEEYNDFVKKCENIQLEANLEIEKLEIDFYGRLSETIDEYLCTLGAITEEKVSPEVSDAINDFVAFLFSIS